MNVQTQIDTDFTRHHRAFRRPDRRRRHFRRWRRLSPHHAMPGNELRRAGSPEDALAAPGPPTAIPASAPTATCTPSAIASSRGRSADRERGGNPEIHGRRDRGERSRPSHPLPAHHHLGEMVERGKPLDHRSHPHRHRREASLHHQFLLDVPGLLPPHRGLYAGVEGHGQIQGPDRPSAEMA